jgi:folylpolyglutamate synthase/dihydropteroate synthase
MDWVVNNYLKKDVKMSNWKDGVSILVDYAHEPESMNKLLETLDSWKKRQIFTQVIHILSSDGDGRDNWKRSIHGDISQKYADFTIFTTDNYNQSDNPQEILDGLSQNFDPASENQTYWKILDRKEAFIQALSCAKDLIEKDNTNKVVIVSTGVGTEWGLTQPSGVMPWYEKDVWIECFDKIT